MAYRVVESLGACCGSCAQGGSCGLGGVQAIDTTVRPGEDVYHYMSRIADQIKTEITVAEAMKKFDAEQAATAAAQAASIASAKGFAVPPDAQASVARNLGGGTSMTTKLIIGAAAALALFMLMGRR